MAGFAANNKNSARDGFEDFYAEKIWELIPGIYKHEDGIAETPGVLRAFVEVLAGQAAIERRSIDRLWSDAHIVDCDDWVIPYIADSLGTRLISPQNSAGRRADVANTIGYRRRSGTLHLLEKLADDIADWDAVAAEGFKRLHRQWHGLDCPPEIGRETLTPQHGFARLTSNRARDLNGTAFSEFSHFPDVKRHKGRTGLYNIPKINMHIFRHYAHLIKDVTPFHFGPAHPDKYTIDPSGRDVPLYMPGRDSLAECQSAEAWSIRAPMLCSLFNTAHYIPDTGGVYPEIDDQLFLSAARMVERTGHLNGSADGQPTLADADLIFANSIQPGSPKSALWKRAIEFEIIQNLLDPDSAANLLELFEVSAGYLQDWEKGPPDPWAWIRLVFDPANGRFWYNVPMGFDGELRVPTHYYGQFFPIGAGPYDRADFLADAPVNIGFSGFQLPGTGGPDLGEGVYEFVDSQTYEHPSLTPPAAMLVTDSLMIQAADGERPYILLNTDSDEDDRWLIDTPSSDDSDPVSVDALVLDGLWMGTTPTPSDHTAQADPLPDDDFTWRETQLVIKGHFKAVTLRHMSLDPGGIRAKTDNGFTYVIPHICLKIEGSVDVLNIERCITGPIIEAEIAGEGCQAGTVNISDSIIMHPGGDTAIQSQIATVNLHRVTVFGNVEVSRLNASDSLIDGTVCVQDPQGSCFRYSTAINKPGARIPKAYRSVVFDDEFPPHYIKSKIFGHPDFAQLSETVPETIRRGAENTSEMGAFNCAIDPIKREDLIYKLSEYTGINVITQLIFET